MRKIMDGHFSGSNVEASFRIANKFLFSSNVLPKLRPFFLASLSSSNITFSSRLALSKSFGSSMNWLSDSVYKLEGSKGGAPAPSDGVTELPNRQIATANATKIVAHFQLAMIDQDRFVDFGIFVWIWIAWIVLAGRLIAEMLELEVSLLRSNRKARERWRTKIALGWPSVIERQIRISMNHNSLEGRHEPDLESSGTTGTGTRAELLAVWWRARPGNGKSRMGHHGSPQAAH